MKLSEYTKMLRELADELDKPTINPAINSTINLSAESVTKAPETPPVFVMPSFKEMRTALRLDEPEERSEYGTGFAMGASVCHAWFKSVIESNEK